MVISDEQWAALPEEEKQRRRKEFENAIRKTLEGYDKETIRAALQATLEEIEGEDQGSKS